MRRLSAEEIGLWQWAMRDVKPLRGGRPVVPDRPESLPAPAPKPAAPIPRHPPQPAAPPMPLDRFAGVDRATAERVKRGRYKVERRLDLHGMTQAEAHRALAGFVAFSRAAGRRCVLVITGHGRMSGGILKAAVPRWLGEPELRRHVLAIAPAQQRDGGDGALYVLLRRLPA
ncbi:MAG TPA: Smr/MutS family protein [Stellaceae bacterium]|nr:Smr/MutS family protein [Stellaceae bacterium]